MPITISYGNPALVGAAAFGVGREKGRMKSGAQAAKMAQGMLDRRDAKREDERNRYDRLTKESADRQQRAAIEAGRIAQDQDEARMKAEAAKNQADLRAKERAEDFAFRKDYQQAGFDQRDKEDAREKAGKAVNLPPSQFFPNAPSSPSPSAGGGGYGGGYVGGQDMVDGSPADRYPNFGTTPNMFPPIPDGRAMDPGIVRPDDGRTMIEFEDRLDRSPRERLIQGRLANRRGFTPQRTMGAQSAIRGRQERYARESGYDPSLYTPEQLRQLNRLASNRGKLSTSDTAHLDQSQKEMVGNQIADEEEKIINNPAGQPSPTLNQIVNDSMTGVNFGGQELPIVLGSDGTPKVMEGYKPQDAGFGGQPQQGGLSKIFQDPMLKGLTLPSGDVLPFTVRQGGIFESPLLNPDDAQVFANRYKNQMLPDGKTPKYNVDIVDSSRGSTMSVSPNYPKTEEEEKKSPELMKTREENRMDYIMENWQKMPETRPASNSGNYGSEGAGLEEVSSITEEPYSVEERLKMAGEQFDAIDRFKNPPPTEAPAQLPTGTEGRYGAFAPPAETPVNEYTGEPRQSVLERAKTGPPASIALPSASIASPPASIALPPEQSAQAQPQSVLSQSNTPMPAPTPAPAQTPTPAPTMPEFKNVDAKVLYNEIETGKRDIIKTPLTPKEKLLMMNEPAIIGGR